MTERSDPLRIERSEPIDGLELVRQAPPAGAQSFAATYLGPGGWGHDPVGAEGTARLASTLLTSAAGPYDRVELARRLDRAGATLTSQCAPESAEVTIWGPAEEWADLLGLLAEVVLRPRFERDDHRRVLRQLVERQLREAAQPASRADRELLRTVFPRGHPYRETGLGDRRSLGRLRRESIVRFHGRHYTADGGILVVTAPARRSAVERVVRQHFRGFPASAAPSLRLPAARRAGTQLVKVVLPGRTQVEIRMGGPSVARDNVSYPAAFLANEILGGRPLLSRLFQNVREKEGLAYYASSDLEAMRLGGYWVAGAGTGADRWERVVRILEDELRRLREEAVGTRELRTLRESAIGEIPLSLESTSDAHELAVEAAYYHLPEDHWRSWPARLRAVGPADLREAAAEAFSADGAVTVVAGPVGRR